MQVISVSNFSEFLYYAGNSTIFRPEDQPNIIEIWISHKLAYKLDVSALVAAAIRTNS